MNEASQRQIAAADPTASTWLAANAGSGKTRVLTDRVARLLLNGVPPQNILCLTYTKAAASEMQNRLFGRLGEWAMKPAEDLRRALAELGVPGRIDDERLAAARRLFARAIETPGGLKIQTIHAFCASLLRQFPLEAGISPQFAEMDERSLKLLCDEVMEVLSEGPQSGLVDDLAVYLSSDESVPELAAELLKLRECFARPMDLPACLAAHGLPERFDEDALLAEVLLGDEAEILAALQPALSAGSANDQKDADRLAPLLPFSPAFAALPVLEAIFLTGPGANAPFTAKLGKFPTKATQAALTGWMPRIEALMRRVEAARPQRIALASARKTAALHRFARVFLPMIEARKAERGWLDFDDLILRARGLLTDPAVADWVLYKLDGGIDHILVDEAQDTSPAQWEVVRLLAREFTAGAGARDDTPRTIFIVGDRKQSIYSFQGADPAIFDAMQRHFDESLTEGGKILARQELLHSFRSAPAILQAVDATFGDTTPGVGAPSHRAFFGDLPGRVDLWPVVPKADPDPDQLWHEPVDRISPRHETAVLADKIAGELRRMIDAGETLPDGLGNRRPLTEGDVLILVQRRGRLFSELIRACKTAGLAIAGADRLKLGQDLAVRDLLALLSFLALPEDDLSLASALRSPLFGWSEDRLYRLAQPRKGYLWEAMRNDPAHADTVGVLDDLRHNSDLLRPYDLLERILTRLKGRERLLARLGPDCEEAIDALLAEALAYEQAEIPSLTGFLIWITSEDVEVKRQAEAAGSRLRIMTVHGAKGLEAPLVILPDCGARRAPLGGQVLPVADGWAAWLPPADAMPDVVARARDSWRARQQEERERLLYVAMTRAECWLIVCAAGDLGKSGDTWHDRVAQGLARLETEPLATPIGEGRRLETGNWAAGEMTGREAPDRTVPPIPGWIAAMAERPVRARLDVLRPSDLGGAKAMPGDAGAEEEIALRRGRQLHLLLEHLPNYPEASWLAFGADILAASDDPALPDEADALMAEATAVLAAPALRGLFTGAALAEVEVTARLSGFEPPMHGIIDRLIVADDHVLAIDFKTNMAVPARPEDTPEGLLRQMGAYAEALAAIYPGHRVETAILWTREARLMRLPHELVTRALRRAAMTGAHLDAMPTEP